MIQEGREVCFMSNIDNLGAIVDFNILKSFTQQQNEFIMEERSYLICIMYILENARFAGIF